MKIKLELVQTPPKILAEHKGEVVDFSANAFNRKTLDPGYSVFGILNDYWETKDEEFQEKVFYLYQKAWYGFDQILSSDELHAHLTDIIRTLYQMHSLQEMEIWMRENPEVRVPAAIEDQFVSHADSIHSEDKTYTTDKYYRLITICLLFRVLTPIWSEYISSNRKSVGTSHKEKAAFLLLNDTGILEADAMQELKAFIALTISGNSNSLDRIFSGDASDDLPYNILAKVCLKRLCVGDIVDPDGYGQNHAVSRVYRFILTEVRTPADRSGGITAKPINPDEDGAEKPRSIVECYRKTMELTMAQLELLKFACSQVEKNVLLIQPDMDLKILSEFMESGKALHNLRVGEPQIALVSALFKTVIPPQSYMYIPNDQLVECVSAAQAVLWHRGMKYMALLVGSGQVINGDELAVSPIDSRAQIPEDVKKELYKYYPYVWATIRRQSKVRLEEELVPEQHRILATIDTIVDLLVSSAWACTARPDRLVEVFGRERRKLTIIPTIKQELAQFFIDVEKRRELNAR